MMMLFLLALALQEPVAQDPKPEPLPATDPLPMVKKKKKKQQQQEELPGATETKPEDHKQGKKKREDYDVRFRVGLDVEYNSNIIRLDDDDMKAFKDGSKPEKFRIKQPDDWIFTPWGEIDIALPLFGETSRAGLRIAGHYFEANSFASNEAFTAYLKGKHYSLEYTFEPSIYRREYKDLDTGVFESAFYDDHLIEGAWKIPIHESILFRPKAGLEIRDYDSPFKYRSSVAPFIAPRATFKATDYLEPFVQYDFVYNQAFASGIQPDTSYYENGFELGVQSRILPELEAELKYRIEHRIYTSKNDPSVDSHAGRKDWRNRLVAGVTWKATSSVELQAAFSQWVVNSTVQDPDEDSDWDRRTYTLGAVVAF
jgi:hypothetical protein